MLSGFKCLGLLLACCTLFIFKPLHAQPGTWAVSGGSVYQDYPEDVLVDAAGNTYISGFYRDTLRLGSTELIAAGQTDIYIAKYDVTGQLDWARSYGWYANEFAHGMAFDTQGNVILVGEYQDSIIFELDTIYSLDTLYYGPPAQTYDVFVLTIDPQGTLLKIKADGWFGSEHFYDVAVDSRNFKLFTGMFRTFNFFGGNMHGKGYDDAFMVLMDTANVFKWKTAAQGRYIDRGEAVAIVGDTTYLMGGTYQDTCWFRDSTVYAITNFEDNVFVVSWDSARTFNWVVTGGGPGKDYLAALKTNAQGEIYICGRFDSTFTLGGINTAGKGGLDAYVAKISSQGTVLWVKTLGGAGFDAASDLAINSDGSLIVTGYFQGQADFNGMSLSASDSLDQDAFIIKLTANGEPVWVRRAGGVSLDKGNAVDLDAAGNIYVYGAYSGTAWFGQQKLVSEGSEDYFLLRMLSDGSVDVAGPSTLNVKDLKAWPNPTNGLLHISFDLPQPGNVSLSLSDLQGRTLIPMIQDRKMGSGSHTHQMNTGELAPGMYFYRLTYNGQASTGRVVIAH